jgi:hypothetical protein
MFCEHSIEPGSTGNVWQSRFDYTEDLFVAVEVLRTADTVMSLVTIFPW